MANSKKFSKHHHVDGCKTKLKVGDPVMVISGGNKSKRANKGQVGKILKIDGQRVTVEGVNLVTRHKRVTAPGEVSQKVLMPGALHVSNVMYYAESHKRPVRLGSMLLADGTKVRGFKSPVDGQFEQI